MKNNLSAGYLIIANSIQPNIRYRSTPTKNEKKKNILVHIQSISTTTLPERKVEEKVWAIWILCPDPAFEGQDYRVLAKKIRSDLKKKKKKKKHAERVYNA